MQGETITDPMAGRDPAAALLDEYLELKDEFGPLEKRLGEVKDRLRDLVTEHGNLVGEVRGRRPHRSRRGPG